MTQKQPNRVPEKYLILRNGHYYLTVVKDGKTVWRTLGPAKSEEEAKELAAPVVEHFLATGELPPSRRGRYKTNAEPYIYVACKVYIDGKYLGTKTTLEEARKLRDEYLAKNPR